MSKQVVREYVARFTERGWSRAPFFDKPATGRSYELVAMEWFEIDDGRIRRRWAARDSSSQASQLGWDAPATRSVVPDIEPTALPA